MSIAASRACRTRRRSDAAPRQRQGGYLTGRIPLTAVARCCVGQPEQDGRARCQLSHSGASSSRTDSTLYLCSAAFFAEASRSAMSRRPAPPCRRATVYHTTELTAALPPDQQLGRRAGQAAAGEHVAIRVRAASLARPWRRWPRAVACRSRARTTLSTAPDEIRLTAAATACCQRRTGCRHASGSRPSRPKARVRAAAVASLPPGLPGRASGTAAAAVPSPIVVCRPARRRLRSPCPGPAARSCRRPGRT